MSPAFFFVVAGDVAGDDRGRVGFVRVVVGLVDVVSDVAGAAVASLLAVVVAGELLASGVPAFVVGAAVASLLAGVAVELGAVTAGGGAGVELLAGEGVGAVAELAAAAPGVVVELVAGELLAGELR